MAGKRLTKAQVVAELANGSDLDKKSVSRVFESLQELIRKQLSARGPGEFVVPGLVKLRVVKNPRNFSSARLTRFCAVSSLMPSVAPTVRRS